MSIIAVKGVPAHWNVNSVKYAITKTKIKSGFEVLNFDTPRGIFKTAYIQVSANKDPSMLVDRINHLNVKAARLTAFIPNHVPDDVVPRPGGPRVDKPRKLPAKHLKRIAAKQKLPLAKKKPVRQFRPTGQTFEWKLITTHKELMDELICKYTKLSELSKKTDNKLLDEIAEELFQRLVEVMRSNGESTETCFSLSKGYRKKHPHFADFQLVLSTLHRLEDAAGSPRTQLSEQDLVSFTVANYETSDLTQKKMHQICAKYENKIIQKVSEHMASLDCTSAPDASPEQAARARVRSELKKIAPYLNLILKQVIDANTVPDKLTAHRMRMYGEPFLPPKDVLVPPLQKHCKGRGLMRSDRLFNLLRFNVPADQFAAAMTLDGTELGGAKLVIRPTPTFEYKVPEELVARMNNVFALAPEDMP